MIIIKDLPVPLNFENVTKKLHADKKKKMFPLVHELIKTADISVKAKAVYNISYLGKREKDMVEIDGVFFNSKVLKVNLEKIEKVFPYIITIGPDLEKKAGSFNDLLKQYYLETIGDMKLHSGRKHLENLLKNQYGLTKLSNMSPGSLDDWPITEQKQLFSLFKKSETAIGVRLTEHMLMIPRKSISGIFFQNEKNFTPCKLCSTERCPSRSAPFDEAEQNKYNL